MSEEYELKIIKYNFNKDEIITEITFELSFDINKVLYILVIPTNPLCEIELLNLNKKPINNIIDKLFLLIKNNNYGYKTTDNLKKLFMWIKINMNSNYNLEIEI
jgi:hypothetical protein